MFSPLTRKVLMRSTTLMQYQSATFASSNGYNSSGIFGRSQYNQQLSNDQSEYSGIDMEESPAPRSTQFSERKFTAPSPAASSSNINLNNVSSAARTFSKSAIPSSNSSNTMLPFPEEATMDYNIIPKLSIVKFSDESLNVLLQPVSEEHVCIKPDGNVYLPEVHYRRLLNKAFGPGQWTLVPRGPHSMSSIGASTVLSREYALYINGCFVSSARGSQVLLSNSATASPALISEGARSNALMRCCKDLGIASELWESSWVENWKSKYAKASVVTDASGKSKRVWSRIKRPAAYSEEEQ